jgi:hypothetical protein
MNIYLRHLQLGRLCLAICFIVFFPSAFTVLPNISSARAIDNSARPQDAPAMLRSRIFIGNQSLIGVPKVLVTLTCNSTSEIQTTISDRLGFFRFGNLQIGDICVAKAQRPGFQFLPATFQFLVFQQLIQGVDFTALRQL